MLHQNNLYQVHNSKFSYPKRIPVTTSNHHKMTNKKNYNVIYKTPLPTISAMNEDIIEIPEIPQDPYSKTNDELHQDSKKISARQSADVNSSRPL